MKRHTTHALFVLILSGFGQHALAQTCLYLSSYHQEYEWNAGIERGLFAVLEGKCEVATFYMDTKRNKGEEYALKMGALAKAFIEETKPDVVVAADDNASKYVVAPYFRDGETPFVFCGVNWTVEQYAYPYTNATGMIEVSPIKKLLKDVQKVLQNPDKGVFLAADVPTQHKEFARIEKLYAKSGVEMKPVFVTTMAAWKSAYADAQSADFVFVSNSSGIKEWDADSARETVTEHTKVLSITTYEWMTDFAMLGMTKIAEEQGEWAGAVALRILAGESPANIPIVPNRRSNVFVNPRLLSLADIELPRSLMHIAVEVGS